VRLRGAWETDTGSSLCMCARERACESARMRGVLLRASERVRESKASERTTSKRKIRASEATELHGPLRDVCAALGFIPPCNL